MEPEQRGEVKGVGRPDTESQEKTPGIRETGKARNSWQKQGNMNQKMRQEKFIVS